MTETRPLGPDLALDDPSLRANEDLAIARALLRAYRPSDAEQRATRDRIVDWIDLYPADAHRRSRLEGHLTASALVVDARSERALLLHHRKLGKWLQPGGHCDGDANLPGVALKEAIEETGMDDLRVVPAIIDVDIHRIPARGDVPAHLHLDSRFLVRAAPGAEPRGNNESNDLAFLPWDAAFARAGDESVARLLRVVAEDRNRSVP